METVGLEGPLLEAVRKLRRTGDRTTLRTPQPARSRRACEQRPYGRCCSMTDFGSSSPALTGVVEGAEDSACEMALDTWTSGGSRGLFDEPWFTTARLVFALVFCCVAMIFLWSPGIGNYAVSHIHYFKRPTAYSVITPRVTRGGTVGQSQLNYLNLLATVFCSLLVTASLRMKSACTDRSFEKQDAPDSPLWDSDIDQSARRPS